MSELMLFLILSLSVARITRFIVSDDLIADPRQKFVTWLQNSGRPDDVHSSSWNPPLWKRKITELVTCPWCVSPWLSGFTILLVLWTTDYSLPLPLFWIPALSMAAVVVIDVVDGVKNVEVKLKQK